MCGIIGYAGARPVTPILIDGLRRLEYRGYDSAGIAVLSPDGALEMRKREGKLGNLIASVGASTPAGTLGVGHTRWATHGGPTDTNAHPHADCEGRMVLVHNGIIENYQSLRDDLTARGHTFRSQTDTEVIVHLVEDEYRALRAAGAPDFAEAVRRALQTVRGAYAIVALCRDDPDLLVAARQNAPLVIGLGDGENLVASDIAAMLEHTRTMLTLDDGEVAAVRRNTVQLCRLDGAAVQREPFNVEWDAQSISKGGYPHFVLKEIHEQPDALAQALVGRMNRDGVSFPELAHLDLSQFRRVALIGCGTAYYAAMLGKYYIEQYARLPVELAVASEFRYAAPVLDAQTLCVFVSQSGETADTLASFRLALEAGATAVALTNTQGSSLTRGASAIIYTQVGPEIGVVATKTFTAQASLLLLLALHLGAARGSVLPAQVRALTDGLRRIPGQIADIIRRGDEVAAVAARYSHPSSAFFMGRNLGYPVALEGALKLKEISYIHAEGYAAGELKHGPIAMLEPSIPVIAVATAGRTHEKLISNIQEVRARQARVLAVVSEGDETVRAHCDDVLTVPATDEALSPLLAVVPLQLFAYHVAVALGRDVDQPRNLAKSVTVE
ncbi:MAG: glutamine--fructose-6-phosphate transaminase (isomerizing) [Chloroflexi bacterium]|nr:glutamine--fructose-6-phosphate transaminase (isomerizing) [Chloroflexota bacterium]